MDFVRHIDIAAMRKRGMVSVVSFIELGVTAAPLAVGGALALASEAERLVSTVPEEMAHLQVHALASPHPAPEDLGRVAEGLTLHDAAGAGTA